MHITDLHCNIPGVFDGLFNSRTLGQLDIISLFKRMHNFHGMARGPGDVNVVL